MKKSLLFSLIFMSLSFTTWSQKENNIWTFGYSAGLDFNSGTAVAIMDSIITEAACASVSSRSGSLLFYTNGVTVWDRNNAIMPNGTGLMGNKDASVLQGAVIVPFLNDTTKYYLFSMEDYTTSNEDDLYYSVIDMNLNNGFGDVVPSQKNIWIDSGMSTSLAAVPGDNCNIWLVTHLRDTNVFKVYEITESGINTVTPIFSPVSAYSGLDAYSTSIIRAAPDMQHLAISNFTISTYSNPELNVYSSLELFDFNQSNGQVSNRQMIDSTLGFFFNFLSLEFSPDGTKLYGCAPFMSLYGLPSVYQYDLSLPTLNAIQNSKIPVGNPLLVGDIRRGPDDKIYVAPSFGIQATNLDRIDDPNIAGVGCNYNPSIVPLLAGTYGTTLFPTPVVYPKQDTFFHVSDTFICVGDTLSLKALPGYFYYSFQNNPLTDSVFKISAPGTYWLTYENYCQRITDTFHVHEYEFDANLNDTILCGNSFDLTLDATSSNPTGTQYLWQDGSSGPHLNVTNSGSYWVTMSIGSCAQTDSIVVNTQPFPIFNLGSDTTICEGDVFLLTGPQADRYLWMDGQTSRTYKASIEGVYSLTAMINGCEGKDTISISSVDCNCKLFVPNAFSPNGDGLNDKFTPQLDCGPSQSRYLIDIFNRWGQRVFNSTKISNSWNGTYLGKQVESGTYFYRIEYMDQKGQIKVQKGDITLIY